MSERPDPEEPRRSADGAYNYDFAQAERILKAMDFLRGEAVKSGIEEICTIIDASFSLLVTTHYCILRYEMTRLARSTEE